MADLITQQTGLDTKTQMHLLESMMRSRLMDLEEQSLIRQGKGWFHVAGMGHESISAMTAELTEGDFLFPYYRDRALVLARGYDPRDIALSFFAKKDSSSAGRQLPSHYSSSAQNIWSLASPVAAHFLPAAGTAWGIKMDGKDNVVIATVGEASTRQGDFYEAICFAQEHMLPIVFVVEDGRVSISTETESMNPLLKLGILNKSQWSVVDGCSVNAVHTASQSAIQKARSGQGPQFLWCQVERLASHSSADDHRNYRSKEELSSIEAKDPLSRFQEELVKAGVISQPEIDAIEERLKAEIKDTYAAAFKAQDPQPGDEMEQITAEPEAPTPPTHLVPGESYRMADAVNQAFKHALDTNENTLFFGEDIEDPLGGVFKLTKGLTNAHPNRVFNSPLAESTILGIACGLASYGKYPIFEIQFIDFIFPGWNQLVNNLGNLRWRTYGDWDCPCLIYAPYGGYLPAGGIWHSQAQESAIAHFPGLHVVVPSTPEDAAAYVQTAMACKDPVIMLLPKHLLWASKEAPKPLAAIPLGKAAIRQEGDAITVVAWGNCIELAREALETFPHTTHVELIDLRSIAPWDKDTLIASVKKTGRLMIVQEDSEACSVGQQIITSLITEEDVWQNMVAPPVLISKDTVCIGFNPVYEYSALPDTETITEALNTLLATNQKTQALSRTDISMAPTAVTTAEQEMTAQAHAVKVPNLGEGLREARVMHLFKKPGDTVEIGDPLCEIETDKAIFPIEAAAAGTFSSWDIEEDDTVEVGQLIAHLETQEPAQPTGDEPVPMPTLDRSENNKALSAEALKQMSGVLPAGLTINISFEKIKALRTGKNRAITASMIVAWAITRALEENPSMCRLLRGNDISNVQEVFDLGLAVALENDVLETAVIQEANELDWPQFIEAYKKAVKDVKNGIRTPKTRTPLIISSMGAYNIRMGTTIVVPPAIAVIFVGETFYEYVEGAGGEPTLQHTASFCITFDHRWINGAGGALFLNSIKKHVEAFELPA